ncbi:hypothetical protein PIB30_036841, partial [Stylosanthes scabra]|nr:hypothetical protein [Stylosanthes scabra]
LLPPFLPFWGPPLGPLLPLGLILVLLDPDWDPSCDLPLDLLVLYIRGLDFLLAPLLECIPVLPCPTILPRDYLLRDPILLLFLGAASLRVQVLFRITADNYWDIAGVLEEVSALSIGWRALRAASHNENRVGGR